MALGKGSIAALTVVGILVVTGWVCFRSYVDNFNYGNETERALVAQLDQNKNVHSAHVLKIKELVQVNDMYAADLERIVTASIQGRYGDDGSKATWQWIKEHNPTLDPSLYTKVQQVIEAGRNEFKNSQQTLIDMKRGYETNLGYFWKGMWLRAAGYPKINLADIKVVISGSTSQTYETGIDAPVQLRPSSNVEKN